LVRARVYVEGGGGRQREFRRGLRTLFERAGLRERIANIDPCGSRAEAFKSFCIALRNAAPGEFVCLLVDSEDPVKPNTSPWAFLGTHQTDQWKRPQGAHDDNAHLMVQCMEAWFLADSGTLERFFGQGFRPNALPNRTDVENIPKRDIFAALEGATSACVPKGQYRKGAHSFEVLATLDPEKVASASPYARRLFDTLKQKTQGT